MNRPDLLDQPATVRDVLFAAVVAGVIAPHITSDPETGQVGLTPAGEALVRAAVPHNGLLVGTQVY